MSAKKKLNRPAEHVRLLIQTHPSNGFDDAEATNGTIYYYKYTGGNQGRGHQDFTLNGPEQTFHITIGGPSPGDYEFPFPDQAFINKDQLPGLSATNDANTVIVTDECKAPGPSWGWRYGVKVRVLSSSATFECDPIIRHRL